MSETITLNLVRDRLVTVWERTHYSVECPKGTSPEEAIKLAQKGETFYEDWEFLDETLEPLDPKENDGQATVEWYLDDSNKNDYTLLKTNV